MAFGYKRTGCLAARLSPAIARVMVPGGVIVSGQPLVGFKAVGGYCQGSLLFSPDLKSYL